MGQAKFSLGQIVATPGALAALERTGCSPLEFLPALQVDVYGFCCDY